jgi:hypothetical protein
VNPHRAARKPYRSPVSAAVCLLLVRLLLPEAGAAEFEDLYTVSVVPDPEMAPQARRADSTQRAMARLLIRVTGRRSAPTEPGLAELVRNAAAYESEYIPLSATESRFRFSRSAIEAVLTRQELPIWGDERPLTLLWIAVDLGGGQRAELAAVPDDGRVGPIGSRPSNELPAEYAELFEAITLPLLDAVDERGLPVVLPELDAADRALVRFADVYGGFDESVALAAERYGADAILIGRIAVTEAGPVVQWLLRQGERRQLLSGIDPRAGIDALAEQFVREYATVGGTRLTFVTIRGIESWPDFGRVYDYVQSRSFIESVDVESQSLDGDMRLRVVTRSDDSQLRQLLTLDDRLDALPPPPRQALDPFAVEDELVFVPAWRAVEVDRNPQ